MLARALIIHALLLLVGCGRVEFQVIGADGGMDAGDAGAGDAGDADVSDADAGTADGGGDAGDFDAGRTPPISVDPFGDGSSFADVFTHAGSVYLGPNRTGDRVLRLLDEGDRTESITFRFTRDVTSTQTSTNISSAPYPSIGSTGCAVNTAACGPDNEDGRGLIASGTWDGAEWLVIGGARSGGQLDYLYVTDDTDSVFDFRFVDISENTGPQTRGLSALGFLGGRLYAGFPDTGGRRPYLVSMDDPPAAGMPGRDTVQNGPMDARCDPSVHDSCDLGATHFPGLGSRGGNPEPTAVIDFIAAFGDRLYLGNNGGLIRSTLSAPLDHSNNPSDWTVITPSDAAHAAHASRTTARTADLTPADRAWPAMVLHQGAAVVARNTDAGPQLWRCDPTRVSGPAPATAADCDSGDWQLIGMPPAGGSTLSRMENPNNEAISVLVGDGTTLYVGFDNATQGVQLYSTSVAVPAQDDFRGEGGCTAPCPGIGGAGFGRGSAVTRLFSSVLSGGRLFVSAGDGGAPVELYRFP